MAGIGFELRKLMAKDDITGFLKAYTYAAVIGAGPWALSIIGMGLIGALNLTSTTPLRYLVEFQATVSYTVMASLCLTSVLQLSFTRYIADRLFERSLEEVVPLFHGALFVTTMLSGSVAMIVMLTLFPAQSAFYKLIGISGFVIASNVWIAVILLSGMRQYVAIIWLFLIGYGLSALAAITLRDLGLEGVLFGFVLGQLVLLVGAVGLVIRSFPAKRFISFEFLTDGKLFRSLVLVGLFYNCAVWVDKLMFWHFPDTSYAVIGPLRASPIYDFPVFLAHLTLIPGMAVFLMRMETDFVEHYERFYDMVRSGGTLETIEKLRNEMTRSVRDGIYELSKIQILSGIALALAAPTMLEFLGASPLSLPVLYVAIVAAGLQTVIMGILNVLRYFDQRRDAMIITGTLFATNAVFTLASLQFGPRYYGVGFTLALLVSCTLAFYLLDRRIERLEYETFMLQ